MAAEDRETGVGLHRQIDLRRSLMLRITLFAATLSLVAVAVILAQARQRIGENIQRTGSTIRQLINDEAARSSNTFRRSMDELDLSTLDGMGRLVHFCAEVVDIYQRPVVRRCFAEPGDPPVAMRWIMGRLIGAEAVYRGSIGQHAGITAAELTVTPNLDREATDVWVAVRAVLWFAGGLLLLNFLVYVPVHRALRPTEAILDTLGRMEAGDLSARLPEFELIELQRIASVFNHLADRLQSTMRSQQQLAERLLGVREEERRHLARELHDEFGQCLTSINAEAAYANELARDVLPELLPCAQAIARTSGHMMESLQQILRQLRPVGLEEFGLVAGLEQLIRGWNQRSHGRCAYRLELDGDFGDLPDSLNVSLYRIVQESLTNATRHGEASEVVVRLERGENIELSIADDGRPEAARPVEPGLGVLGMHERVQALGGSFILAPREPRGMIVAASIPRAAIGSAPA